MGLCTAAALRLGRVGSGLGGFGAGRVLLMVFVALQLGSVDPLAKSSTTHSTA